MQSRLQRTILFVFLILIGGGLLYRMAWTDHSSSYLAYERDFAFQDKDRIHTIFIANRAAGTRYILKRQPDNSWTVNDQKANQRMIDDLLRVFPNIRIRYQPSASAYPNIMHQMIKYALKIELYDEDGALLKCFYLGGDPPDSEGTLAMMCGADQPYVVQMGIIDGSIYPYFDWVGEEARDPFVFPFDPEEIDYYRLDYPYASHAGFQLMRLIKDSFALEPAVRKSTMSQPHPVQGRIWDYLYALKKLEVIGFINEDRRRDTVLHLRPYAEMTVIARGDTMQLKVYPMHPTRHTVVFDYRLVDSLQPFYYFGLYNDTDFVALQQTLLHPLLKTYADLQ